MERFQLAITQSPVVRYFRERPLFFDVLLAVAVGLQAIIVVLSFINTELTDLLRQPTTAWEWVLVTGPAWLVPLRRIFPTPVVLAGALAQALVWAMDYPDTYLAMAVLNYSAAAYGGGRGRLASWLTAGALTLWTAVGVATGDAPVYAIPIVALFSSAAVSLGVIVASNRSQTEAAEAKAEQLERSQVSDRERALVEERARIARELHDVVAHGLSVIVVQAAAARRIIDRDPTGAGEALSQIEDTGRNALNEMRHVLAAIRTDPEESWEPAPGLGAIDALVEELAATGLTVTVTDRTKSDPNGSNPTGSDPNGSDRSESEAVSRAVPATVDVTAYRIVREALTNVLKHAGRNARATVDIVRGPRSLELEIVDNGRGAKAADGGGHGLRGMQERVEVFGGQFRAGPRPGRGFAVSVSLPFEASSEHRSPTGGSTGNVIGNPTGS